MTPAAMTPGGRASGPAATTNRYRRVYDTMTDDTETNGQDEPTLNELRERRESMERMGGSGKVANEKIEAWKSEVETLNQIANLRDAKDRLSGVEKERADEKIEQLSEVVEAPVRERIGDLEAEADEMERQGAAFENRPVGEPDEWQQGLADRAREKAEERRQEAETLRAKLDGGTAETMSAGGRPATGSKRSHPKPSAYKIDVEAAVDRYLGKRGGSWSVIYDVETMEELPAAMRDTAKKFDGGDYHGSGEGQRGMAKLFDAYNEGVGTIELDTSERPGWAREGKEATPRYE